ncbi:phosphopantetheine-binding protein [Geoalkalibacter halelectricus]|uniref:Phosphopantetheine-binding protein n=1 Tax=Geoalkalibacter halelectricus TaxID=2847045 RepID=A0ABY5ZPU7_9BACT|nr:phosphopantetheine-binding protein [Geoalkalibacter halelectricus]MDO3379835.1 phosphopantetheine-binding protein [Geoalkalibacter halelectricus]UWZ80633.1 phosphopantetheine-binding protein [Geoalkalibacter halelectricus]
MDNLAILHGELQELIIDACNVPDAPDTVDPDAPLIGPDSSLGLDSLDAVEVVVAVQKKYDVRIGGEDSSREVLRNLRTLAEFIDGKRTN